VDVRKLSSNWLLYLAFVIPLLALVLGPGLRSNAWAYVIDPVFRVPECKAGLVIVADLG
jgi:uncharacterized membrane protein